MLKTNLIKLSNKTTLIHLNQTKIIILVTKKKTISLTLKTKFIILPKYLIITNINNKLFLLKDKNWNYYLKTIHSILKLLKKINFKVKLKIKGLGYKFFEIKQNNMLFIKLKLGFSHLIYYKIPININVFFFKPTFVIFSSNDLNILLLVVSNIKKFKLKEPYKGKGIFYENESIKIKTIKI